MRCGRTVGGKREGGRSLALLVGRVKGIREGGDRIVRERRWPPPRVRVVGRKRATSLRSSARSGKDFGILFLVLTPDAARKKNGSC